MSFSEQAARRTEALGPAIRGMLWMTLCGLCFAGLNATTRVITADLHSWQTVCLRYAFGALVMLPLVLRTGMGVLRTNNLRLQVARCAVHSLGTGMWFLALPLVPLAEITAISFTSPIFLAIGAILFFGEKVRSERWIAIGVGFLGVLLVLYPKLEHGIAANWASLLLVAAAPVSASSYLLAKRLMRYDKTETIVLWQAMLVSLFTLPCRAVLLAADDADAPRDVHRRRHPGLGRPLRAQPLAQGDRYRRDPAGALPRTGLGLRARLPDLERRAAGLDLRRRHGDLQRHDLDRPPRGDRGARRALRP